MAKNKRLLVELSLMKLNNIVKTFRERQEQKEQAIKNMEIQKQAIIKQVAEKKIVKAATNVKKTTSFSIKDAINGTAKPVVRKENIQDTKVPTQKEQVQSNEPLTQERVNTTWLKYAETFKKNQPRFYSSFKVYIPEIISENTLQLNLSNESQKEKVLKLKPEMLHFLRKWLQNSSIDIVIKISKAPNKNKRPYNNSEKFNYLNEKNPNLMKLKQQFGLEF